MPIGTTGNRKSYKFEDWQAEQRYKKHQKKLKAIRSRVDNKAPKRHKHLERNRKKEQTEKERAERIYRENRILLEKISGILLKERASVDNVNEQPRKLSLNYHVRQQELERIAKENQEILKRIEAREPVYSHKKWEAEYEQNQKYFRNLCEYEPVGFEATAAESPGRGRAPRRTKTAVAFEDEGVLADGIDDSQDLPEDDGHSDEAGAPEEEKDGDSDHSEHDDTGVPGDVSDEGGDMSDEGGDKSEDEREVEIEKVEEASGDHSSAPAATTPEAETAAAEADEDSGRDDKGWDEHEDTDGEEL